MFNIENVNELVDSINKLEYPYIDAYSSTLGGPSDVSILFVISKQPKNLWPHGYIENSDYARFHLFNNGRLEKFSGFMKKTFRKCTVKDFNQLKEKLNKYFIEN